MTTNDTLLDPYDITYKLFRTFYSGHENIQLEDFKKFFYRFHSYFDPNDLELFFKEVALLAKIDGLIDIKEIAAMIKNDVDMFPN